MMVGSGDLPETGTAQGTSRADPARLDRLEHQIAELRGVIAGLQPVQNARPPAGEPIVRQAAARSGRPSSAGPPAEDTLSYAGNVGGSSGRMVVAATRTVEDVLNADPQQAGRVFGALASPARITLLKTLLGGPRSTQQLRGVLDDPSVGQLYHHLKELLAAGIVIQPGRSMYALRRGSQVEVCILVLAASGLASGGAFYPPPDSEQSAGSGEPPGPS